MSLISDGGTLFSVPFSARYTSLSNVSFFAWVKFKGLSGAQCLGQLANTDKFSTGLSKASVGIGPLVASQFDDFGQQIFAADQNQSPVSGRWYAVFGSMAMRLETVFKSTQTPLSVHQETGLTGQSISTWNQIQFAGKQTEGAPLQDFLSAGSLLAEFTMWDKILDIDPYVNMLLFQGISPRSICKENIICHCPLRMDARDTSRYRHAFMAKGTGGAAFGGEHPILTEYIPHPSRTYIYSHGFDGAWSDTFTSSDEFTAAPIAFTASLSDTSAAIEFLQLQNIIGEYGDTIGSADQFIPTGYPGNWSDSAVTSERYKVLVGSRYDDETDDFNGSTDAFTGTIAATGSWSDSNGSSDAFVLLSLINSFHDTVATSDSVGPITHTTSSYSDTVATSDQFLAFMYLASLADTAATSTSLTGVMTPVLSLSDAVATTDFITIFFRATMRDTVTSQTSLDSVLSINQTTRVDFVSSSDQFSSNLDFVFDFSTIVATADQFVPQFMMGSASLNYSAVTLDSFRVVASSGYLVDAIVSHDAFVSSGYNTSAAVTNVVASSDALTQRMASVSTIADTIVSSDNFTSVIGYTAILADTVATSTSVTGALARVATMSDTIHATDQVTAFMALSSSIADIASLFDAYPLPKLSPVQLHDISATSDLLTPSPINLNKVLADSSAASDHLYIQDEIQPSTIPPVAPPASTREQKLREKWLIDTGS